MDSIILKLLNEVYGNVLAEILFKVITYLWINRKKIVQMIQKQWKRRTGKGKRY